MRRSAIAAAALLAGCLSSCATTPATSPTVTFVVVRHAEKADDDPRDPSLSAAGERRAAALAECLADAPLVAAYATPYRRTRATAAPAAAAHRIVVRGYDPSVPPAETAQALRGAHNSGTVLVVGHSNTVPALVSALCDCTVAPLGDGDFGNLHVVTFRGTQRGELFLGRFGP